MRRAGLYNWYTCEHLQWVVFYNCSCRLRCACACACACKNPQLFSLPTNFHLQTNKKQTSQIVMMWLSYFGHLCCCHLFLSFFFFFITQSYEFRPIGNRGSFFLIYLSNKSEEYGLYTIYWITNFRPRNIHNHFDDVIWFFIFK